MWPFFQSIWFWQEGFIQEELIMQKGSSISWGSLGATDFEFFGASESPRPLGMSNWQHHPGMIAGIAWLYRQNHCGSSQFLFLQPPVVDERNLCIYIYLYHWKTWATWQSTIDHSMDFRQSSHLWDMGTAWATTPQACNKQQTQQTATCRHLGESIT